MDDAPEVTPEEEPEDVEVERLKTGAELWKERRALIIDRNKAASDRSKAPNDRGTNRVADQRRANAEREAAQLRASNGNLTKKRSRG